MITRFRGEYRWLSNFWPCRIPATIPGRSEYEGLFYPSAEHAFQAAKARDPQHRVLFLSSTAGEAKALGRRVRCRPDWDTVKCDIMRQVLALKFAAGTSLADQLLATGTEELVEGNSWHDTFWGQCPLGTGQNWLGRLLMAQRQALRDKVPFAGER